MCPPFYWCVGGGANRPPPVVFGSQRKTTYARVSKFGEILFLTINWEYCVKMLSSYLAERRIQSQLLGQNSKHHPKLTYLNPPMIF